MRPKDNSIHGFGVPSPTMVVYVDLLGSAPHVDL